MPQSAGATTSLAKGLAIILDMDGVIVDSNPAHSEAWRVYNRRMGLETTAAMLRFMYGKRNDEIVREFYGTHLTEEQVRKHGESKEMLYREMMAPQLESLLIPGAVEFLRRSESCPLGLASNAERANVDFILDNAGIRRFFRVVVDGGQVREPKPSPEIYLRVAKLLSVSPENCVVFEDSESGCQAASAAGARVVGIRSTLRTFSGVDLAIDDFRSVELEPWLESQRPR